MNKHRIATAKIGRRRHVFCSECFSLLVPADDWIDRFVFVLLMSQISRADFALASGISYCSFDKVFSGARGFAWLASVSAIDLTDLLEDDSCRQLVLPSVLEIQLENDDAVET